MQILGLCIGVVVSIEASEFSIISWVLFDTTQYSLARQGLAFITVRLFTRPVDLFQLIAGRVADEFFITANVGKFGEIARKSRLHGEKFTLRVNLAQVRRFCSCFIQLFLVEAWLADMVELHRTVRAVDEA